MPEYIEVVRHFFKLGSQLHEHPAWIPRRSDGLTWNQLLRPEQTEHLVLLAPSGYGKSTEVFHEARRLQAQGTHAIAALAVATVEEGFRSGLETETRDQFDAWFKGTSPLILFVDAFDELALRHRNLGDLIRKLEAAVPFSERPVRLIVTARTGMWLPHHTGELQHFLAGGRDEEPPVTQISFLSLDEPALRALATGFGANDVDELIASIRREEIRSLFDIRPRDVGWLVRKWNESGRLGKWVELLNDFCETALSDETLERALQRELSMRDAHLGLERAAAAMEFGKQGFISVPSAEASDLTISSRRLFEDWTTARVQNLLETALFVHKGMNGQAVQLAADTLRPFLAARWLGRRAKGGLEIDTVQELVMVRAFAEKSFHIPASRMALAGWLAMELPDFRALVLRQRPDVVLFRGDPELLTDQEIEIGLAGIATELLTGSANSYARLGILRKLARPSVEGLVLSLLSTRPTTDSLQYLSLELVRYGRYRKCLPLAIALGLDRNTTEHIRTAAISATIEVGDSHAWDQLVPLTDDPSPRVRAQLLELVPKAISGAPLVRLMQRGGELEFRLAVRAMVERISDTDLQGIAAALASLLDKTQTEQTYCSALPVVTESIRRGHATAAALRILLGIDRLLDHAAIFISDEEIADLRTAFETQTRCRRALINARLAARLSDPYGLGRARFGEATAGDVPWLVAAWKKSRRQKPRVPPGGVSTPTMPQRADLIEWLLSDLYDGLGTEEQALVRARLPQPLQQSAEGRTQSKVEVEQARARHEMTHKRRASLTRSKYASALRPRLKQIERGDDVQALRWAWSHLGAEQGTKRVRRDFSRLAEVVGDDLVPSVLRGLQAYWRKHTVSVPDPSSNRVDVDDLAGLTGLTLEIENGLDLRALSLDEARRAATYGLYELNTFPTWFDDLLSAQPIATNEILREAVTRAWTITVEKPTLLRFGPYAGTRVASVLRSLLLEVAVATPPGARQALEDGIDTLLTSGDGPRVVAKIALRGIVTDAGNDGRLAQWFRLLAHVDPIAAAGHMESMRTTDLVRYSRTVEVVASFLEHDVSDRYKMALVTSMKSPRALGRWFRLLLLGVAPESDLDLTTEPRMLGSRDYAQNFRERCVALLRQDPTEAAHDVLLELSNDPALATYRPLLVAAVAHQLEVARDAIARPWTEDEILTVERRDERTPRTLDDLFAMVRSHIVHVDRLISVEDDFSYRSIFSKNTLEEKIQLWTASCLRVRARGLYSVTRENAVAVTKKVDISAMVAGVGQVPIEIKPLGPYSFNALKGIIVDQLLGQYMRPNERRCGVLLLVRRERTRWEIGGKRQTFDKLVSELQAFASVVGNKHGKTIVVEAIDLLGRLGSSSLHRP